MKAGTAKRCITPPIGIPLGGTFQRPVAESVHDDLWARSLALEDAGRGMVITSVDLLGIRPEFIAKVAWRVQGLIQVPAAHIIYACTHTHSGPDVAALMHDPIDSAYCEALEEKLVESACEAWENRRTATVRYGTGQVEGQCTNRRVLVQGGKVRMNWEAIPAEEIIGRGPIDPRLGLLAFDGKDGSPIAVIVHWTCHPAIVSPEPRQISADFPGVVNRMIERFGGEGRMPIFLNGAFGNINHILKISQVDAMLRGTAPGRPFEEMERVGTAVGMEALRVLGKAEKAESSMAIATTRIDLPVRALPVTTPGEANAAIARANEELGQAEMAGDPARIGEAIIAMTYARQWKMMLERNVGSISVPLRAFRIGQVAFVTLPGEPFVELGFNVRKASRFAETYVVGNADYYGYLPTGEAFAQGGYEVRTCTWSQFREDSDRALTFAAGMLLEKLE